MWFRNLSIFKKFMLTFLVLVIIPTAVWTVFLAWNNYYIISGRESDRVNQTMQLVKTNVDLELERYETKAKDIYYYQSVFDTYRANWKQRLTDYQIKDINVILKGIRANDKYLSSICLFLDNGQYAYGSTQNASNEHDIRRHKEWFEEAKQLNGKGYWISSFALEQQSAQCISYSFIVKDTYSDFRTIGTMFTNVDIALLQNICNSVELGAESYFVIEDGKGNITWAKDTSWIGKKHSEVAALAEISDERRTFEITSEKTGWKYKAYVAEETLNAQFNVVLMNNMLILLVLIILFIICIRIIRKNIVYPIQKMAVAMEHFNTPDFENRLTMTGNDEIGALAGSFLKMREQIIELINQIKQTEKKERDQEIKALQAQINPHFLYNTLDTVYWMADENGEQEICETVIALSEILRYSLSKKNMNACIREEIANIKNYISIQKVRFEELFDVVYEIDEQIYQYSSFKLLLQPFVENAILHGFSQRMTDGLIIVRGWLSDGNIIFEVEDNGCGMSKERTEYVMSNKNEGIGILNIHNRIQYLYGEEYGILIRSTPGKGTCIHIQIPAILYKQD